MDPGRLIRAARTEADLTQTELARRSGTSQATVSAYESGHKSPSASTLTRILAAAGFRLAMRPAARPVHTPTRGEFDQRGRILAEVLDLAERLPARRSARLPYPPLIRSAKDLP